jgi:hypothetical protein
MKNFCVLLLVPCLGSFACSGGDDGPSDAAEDGTTDAPNEASKDGATDASRDASADARLDVSQGDSASDAGPDADDASTDASISDGPTTLDVVVTCGAKMGYGIVSVSDGGGACATGEDYTCGADSYQLECDCPSATCTCEKNGSVVGSGGSFAGCPSCSSPSFSTIATMCGVPY